MLLQVGELGLGRPVSWQKHPGVGGQPELDFSEEEGRSPSQHEGAQVLEQGGVGSRPSLVTPGRLFNLSVL